MGLSVFWDYRHTLGVLKDTQISFLIGGSRMGFLHEETRLQSIIFVYLSLTDGMKVAKLGEERSECAALIE